MDRTLLGFDFGRARIGVALGNTVTGTARALAIIGSEPSGRRWREIAALVAQWGPALLVVGRPVPDERRSNVGETAALCERFARQLAQRTGLPVEVVDESGSSVEAQAILRERRAGGAAAGSAGGRQPGAATAGRRKRHGAAASSDDGEAAAVILRQYLNDPRGRDRVDAAARDAVRDGFDDSCHPSSAR